MDTTISLLVLAVLVIAIYQYLKRTSGGITSVLWRNTVQRDTHKKSQSLVRQELYFTANAPVPEVMNAILRTVGSANAPRTLVADLYIFESSSSQIVFAFGNKLQTYFRSSLQFQPVNSGNGTTGTWKIVDWLEQDGMVAAHKAIEKTISNINTALASVDSKALLSPTRPVLSNMSQSTSTSNPHASTQAPPLGLASQISPGLTPGLRPANTPHSHSAATSTVATGTASNSTSGQQSPSDEDWPY